MNKIKVLVVDDSAVVRQVVAGLLAEDHGIEVISAVADPLLAMARMKIQWPDVIVLDVEMPRMDGITFLKKIMHERPTPVVICSTLTEKGAHTTMEALAAGAVAIITKPKLGLKQFFSEASDELKSAVKAAASANVSRLVTSQRVRSEPEENTTPMSSCRRQAVTQWSAPPNAWWRSAPRPGARRHSRPF